MSIFPPKNICKRFGPSGFDIYRWKIILNQTLWVFICNTGLRYHFTVTHLLLPILPCHFFLSFPPSKSPTPVSLFCPLPVQMFPYSLLAMAVLMYLPALIWRQLVMPTLSSDLLFIIDELDNSYNRSIRMAQSILDMRQLTKNPLTFQAELQR